MAVLGLRVTQGIIPLLFGLAVAVAVVVAVVL
jgi:hypothetical protein